MNIFERTESSAVEDYYLVMGQCAGDSVVTQMAYGNYLDHLYSIVAVSKSLKNFVDSNGKVEDFDDYIKTGDFSKFSSKYA